MKDLKVNCLIGDIVYKICPRCNDRHNGTCENCAWGSYIWNYCSIDVKIYEDGSFLNNPLQVVKRIDKEIGDCAEYNDKHKAMSMQDEIAMLAAFETVKYFINELAPDLDIF